MPAAERRKAILDAALDEFAEHGFHETSLEGVAERAGISKALIYEHFSSKRDLHDALLGACVHELLERLIEAITTADPPEVRLRAGADAFLAFVEERREPWRLLVRNPQEAGVDAPVGEVGPGLGHAVAALMHSDFPAEMEADPAEAEFIVEMAGQQLVGALRALANWWDEHREVPRERMVTMLMDFAWLGLERLTQGETWKV
jgi:AcrR family transcriptional regulator